MSSQSQEHVLARLSRTLTEFRRVGERARDRIAKRLGMHPTDYGCLTYLHIHGACAPRDIIAHLGLTSGSGTALFDRLERDGYLRRAPNPADRRSVLIELNADRAAAVIASLGELEDIVQASLVEYSEAEAEIITRFFQNLKAISEKIDAYSEQQ